jgi:hypothetical protein
MAQFSGNAQRLDPYKNFKFRLWDGDRTYFGNKLTGLFPPPDVIEYREGSDSSGPHKSLAGMKGDATTGNQKANLSFSEGQQGLELRVGGRRPDTLTGKTFAWSFTTRRDSQSSVTESMAAGFPNYSCRRAISCIASTRADPEVFRNNWQAFLRPL